MLSLFSGSWLVEECISCERSWLQPNILVVNGQGKRGIIDTKWKMIHSDRSRHGVKREDFYQMYAYLTRYKDMSEVILLYPYHDGITASGERLEVGLQPNNDSQKQKQPAIEAFLICASIARDLHE